MIRGREITADSLVWISGMDDWQPAGKVSQLAGYFAAKDPVAAGPPPKDRLITSDSAGLIKAGMTIAEARKAMKSATFSRGQDGEGIAFVDVNEGETFLLSLYAGEEDPGAPIDETREISSIDAYHEDFKTVDGVHAGMKLGDAVKTYGGVKEIIRSEIESREYVDFAKHPPGLSFRLKGASDLAGIYSDGESRTARFDPEATILEIGLSARPITEDGSIGGIKLDFLEGWVQGIAEKLHLGPLTKGEDEILDALGQAVQTWAYAEAGLSLEMISEKIGGQKKVFSISLKAPSTLLNRQGIGIGTDKTAVAKAYAGFPVDPYESSGFSDDNNTYLVGSIFGGMLFSFENDRVTEIFLGPMAE